MAKIAKAVNKINFTMLYGNYCYIIIKDFPQKFSPCGLKITSFLQLSHDASREGSTTLVLPHDAKTRDEENKKNFSLWCISSWLYRRDEIPPRYWPYVYLSRLHITRMCCLYVRWPEKEYLFSSRLIVKRGGIRIQWECVLYVTL